MVNELHYAIANLSSWMKPEYVSKNLVGSTRDTVFRSLFHASATIFGIIIVKERLDYTYTLMMSELWQVALFLGSKV